MQNQRESINVDDREIDLPTPVKVVQMSDRELPEGASPEQQKFLNECLALADAVIRQGKVYGRRRLRKGEVSVRKQYMQAARSTLGHFRQAITEYQHVGASIFARQVSRMSNGPQQDDKIPAILLGIHVRACQVAREIHCLAQAGFTDGALARWRAIHELAVTAIVIAENEHSDLAEDYLRQEGEIYQRLQDHMNVDQAPSRESVDTTSGRAGQRWRRGEYAWAASLFSSNGEKSQKARSPTFRELEQMAGLSRNRPLYSLASNGVHQNPLEVLGIVRTPEKMLTPVSPSEGALAICVYHTIECLDFTLLSLVVGGSNEKMRLYDCVEMLVAGILGQQCQDATLNLGNSGH